MGPVFTKSQSDKAYITFLLIVCTYLYLFVLLCTSATGNVELGGRGGKINNKLIVNYLPQSMTDEAFTNLFAKCGQVC